MRTSLILVSGLALSLAACTPPKPATTTPGSVVRYSSDAAFDEVRDDVEHAILAKGLVIDNTAYVAKMLDRTRKDVGSEKVLYADARGQAFTFCSAVVSRKSMEVDPHNIAFCPYSIVVYSIAAEPKKVYVAYRRALLTNGSEASKTALQEVDALLDGIVREAVSKTAKPK